MKALNENLSYEFRPAGHKMKIERRDYIKTESKLSKLYEVFEKWLYEVIPDFEFREENYNKAVKMIKDIKPTIYEAHLALIDYQDHPKIKYAGLFLSAVYNLVPDKVIVYDVDLDVYIDYLGYRLENGKTLVNRSKVGNYMGLDASGIVVNYGRAGNCMGEETSGIVINYGEVGNRMGFRSSGIVINYGKAEDEMGFRSSGIVINYGKAGYKMGYEASGKIIAIKNPKSFCCLKDAELVLNEEECRKIPWLIDYFDELKNKIYEGRNNPELLLKMFSDNPAEEIRIYVEISIIIFSILSKLSKIRRFFKLL